MKKAQRGQTMVLWALALLLLSLMVLTTLSFGQKVKEKMEVQTVADAAALSNATVTARVFNSIALMNRANIGQMVSMAAVESLISWSSYYRAQLAATRGNYNNIRNWIYIPLMVLGCLTPSTWCTCMAGEVAKLSGTRQTKLITEETRILSQWDTDDQAAGTQAKLLQTAASALQLFEWAEYIRLELKIQNQALAGQIVNRAKSGSPWSGEWSAPGGADNVATREIFPVLGSVEPIALFDDHAIAAAMGSRGWSFTRDRGNAKMVLMAKIKTLIDPQDQVIITDTGSGYWADAMNHSNLFPSGTYAWADDHGNNILTFLDPTATGCLNTGVWSENVMAFVHSTDSGDSTDMHMWFPIDSPPDAAPAINRHTMGSCLSCPGMWPLFTDYNEVRAVMSGDNNGQPKNYATIVRDYHARPSTADPWNLFFNFKLGSTGGADYDSRGITLGAEAGGIDVGRQVGLSTGIAYYHRRSTYWKEPPNFLNPYWRATLVPLDIDDQGKGNDAPDTLNNAGAGYAAQAYSALKGAGFKGWP